MYLSIAVCASSAFFTFGYQTLVRLKWVSHTSFQGSSLVIEIQKTNKQKQPMTDFMTMKFKQMKKQQIFPPCFRTRVSISSKLLSLKFDKLSCFSCFSVYQVTVKVFSLLISGKLHEKQWESMVSFNTKKHFLDSLSRTHICITLQKS